MSWLRKLHRLLIEVVLIPVHVYRRWLSPRKSAPTCRFTPTCSRYALDAVYEWGIVCGIALAIWRVLRCNPFSRGGYDPVPRCPWKKHDEAPDENRENK